MAALHLDSSSATSDMLSSTTNTSQQTSLHPERLRLISNSFNRTPQGDEIQRVGPLEVSKAQVVAPHHEFSLLIEPQVPAVDQGDSGLCWIYAAFNVLRIDFVRQHQLPPEFQFSVTYIAFYDKLEKAHLFLQKMIALKNEPLSSKEVARLLETPLDSSGKTSQFDNIVNKYGIVPLEAMPDDAFCLKKPRFMNEALDRCLRIFAERIRSGESEDIDQMMSTVYCILATNLGVPPNEFSWTYTNNQGEEISEKLTPLVFAKEFVKHDSEQYLVLASNPCAEDKVLFEAQSYTNVAGASPHRYINVPIDLILGCIDRSLEAQVPVFITTETRFDKHDGDGVFDAQHVHQIPLYGERGKLTRKQLLEYKHITPWHCVVVTGSEPGERYKILNSWNLTWGRNCNYSLAVDYARLYLFRAVVRKEFVPEEIRDVWEKAIPVQLSPDDLIM